MNNIESQIQVIESASRGEDVRDAIISALRALYTTATTYGDVDNRLSITSQNPVQNKVIAQKIAVLESQLSNIDQVSLEDLIEAYDFVGWAGDTNEVYNDYENNVSTGGYAHAEGYTTEATGFASHAEGDYTNSTERYAHAEGFNTNATGEASHAEGYQTSATKRSAHAENRNSQAMGESSHAEGYYTQASGDNSHAEGESTHTVGNSSHSEGRSTLAIGQASHAEGENTHAIGQASHAEGTGTQATGASQHVAGKYNATNDNLAEIVGNGSDSNNRSNARTLDWNGNATYAGKVTAGANASNAMDLTTLSQVQALIAALNIPTAVTIDDALDDLSENPVQNSVITSELRAIQNRITSGIESINVEQAIAANTMITNTLNSAITNMQSTISTSLTNFNNRATALENRFNEIEQQFQALNIVNDTEY